jgi:hypothetical protein
MGRKKDKVQNYTIPKDCLDCSRDILNDIERLMLSIGELLNNTSRDSKLANASCIAEIVSKVLDATDQCVKDDACHDFKRRISFEILDGLLHSCNEGNCPVLDPAYHKCLIDISAEGYILKRAYYYSANEGTESEKEDYYKAISRIERIFSCPLTPKLDAELFEIDNNDLQGNQDHQRGAERRKAFWRHLARKKSASIYGDHYSDYCDSCEFLKIVTSDDSAKLNKAFYEDNIDMVNGLDLFRFCIARGNSVQAAAENKNG